MSNEARDKVWFMIIGFLLLICFNYIQKCDAETPPVIFPDITVERDIYRKCLEGHEYYIIMDALSSALAPRLDDNGKPVSCEVEKIVIDVDPLEIFINDLKKEIEEQKKEQEKEN